MFLCLGCYDVQGQVRKVVEGQETPVRKDKLCSPQAINWVVLSLLGGPEKRMILSTSLTPSVWVCVYLSWSYYHLWRGLHVKQMLVLCQLQSGRTRLHLLPNIWALLWPLNATNILKQIGNPCSCSVLKWDSVCLPVAMSPVWSLWQVTALLNPNVWMHRPLRPSSCSSCPQ